MSSLPQPLAVHFTYRGSSYRLELVRRTPALFAIPCPVCATSLSLDPRVHHPIVDLVTRSLTIRPEVRCTNSQCGWYVRVRRGVALDVDPPPAPERASSAINRKGRRASARASGRSLDARGDDTGARLIPTGDPDLRS